jgi:dTDP-4-amino-4,6-dideoxygalactose transaminase
MKIKYLDFPAEYQSRKKEYFDAFDRVMKSGAYVLSGEVEGFENKFAKYLGVKYCVGVANGLEALQIALMAKNIGNGDEVITTPVSAVATTLSIIAVGAKPVFVDTNEYGQIDANKIEGVINKKTRAILPVDLYGQPCDLPKIKDLCNKCNLFLLEDACQAHGSTLNGKKLGTFGDVGAFSFYPTKNIGAIGDGGALVTNDPNLAEEFREIRDYGQKSKYIHSRYGLNSRLDELQAAFLKIKLKYLDHDNNIKKKIAESYVKNLADLPGLKIVLPEKLSDSNFHLFVIRTKKRDDLKNYLMKNGIPALIHYPLTIPQQPVIKNLKIKTDKFPVSEKFVNEILSLPCHTHLKKPEVDYISSKIKEFFTK